jgi:sugar phosphate isomerase/epimerase
MKHNAPTQSRREFLKASAATGAALVSASVAKNLLAEQPQPNPTGVIVGGHPWVYAAKQPGYDITPILPAIFADMRYAGLDGIELMHTALRPDDAVERIADLSQKHRLPIIGASFSGEMWNRAKHASILKDAEKVVTRLGKLGGRTLGTSVGPAPHKKTPQQLDDQADLLRKIIALCRANGVVLNLHNHTYEVVDNRYDLKGTLARIPDVKLGPDLNWLVRGGVSPAGFIRRYGERIVFLHLRDQTADGRWSEALGEGNMDYTEIGNALREVQFRGPAVIELAHEGNFKPTRPLRESLKISRDFVRRVLGY